MTQSSEAHLSSLLDAFCRSLGRLQHECGLTDISPIAVSWMLGFTVLSQTLTHTAPCCCLCVQGFSMITSCDDIVMKICRAVSSSCLCIFCACLFSCCVSEVCFLLYFSFLLFPPYSGKEICEEGESCAMRAGKGHAHRLILFSCQGV